MTSVWPAIIAALAALAGVFLGQVFQAQRDRLAHQRELEREERKRASEATTRFMDNRLQAFSEYLAELNNLYEIWEEMQAARREIGIEAQHRVPLPEDRRTALMAKTNHQELRMDGQQFRLELLASPQLARAAFRVYVGFTRKIEVDAGGRDKEPEYLFRYHHERERLIELMREELRDPGTCPRNVESPSTLTEP